jgi:glucose-6-phosphate-specific signal transduction histidine kinase
MKWRTMNWRRGLLTITIYIVIASAIPISALVFHYRFQHWQGAVIGGIAAIIAIVVTDRILR